MLFIEYSGRNRTILLFLRLEKLPEDLIFATSIETLAAYCGRACLL